MEQSNALITSIERVAPDIVRLSMLTPSIAQQARPGQFINLRTGQGFDPLLRRPFSIHQTHDDGTVQIIFKVVGKGTAALAGLRAGQVVNLVGPLGNHFTINGDMCLVGGGLGIAPLLFLVKEAQKCAPSSKLRVILGARNREELFSMADDFRRIGINPHLATDDGSLGHHGLVTDLLPEALSDEPRWQVRTCGPFPMMQNVAAISRMKGWPCQVSLETTMACGISACLGCTVRASATNRNGSTYLHVCKDGPIFDEGDVLWNT